MNKFRLTINALAVALFALAFASAAQAQATRTWVSGVGDDANPCSRTAPCKTFAGAISKTADGGEIDALDPGGFGAVTITKNITIDGTGTLASILSAGTNGVIVNAPATATVTLHNISINGAGTGINGIRFLAGKALNVIGCFIQGVTTHGIDVAMNQASLVSVFVADTVIKKCGGDGLSLSNSGAGPTKYALERSSFVECANGLHVKASSQGTANNCVFGLNSANGVFADAVAGGSFAVARVWNSQITGNGQNGVVAGNGGNLGTSVVEISQDQIDQNVGNGALVLAGGTINTFTNNSIQGNGTNGCPSCTSSGPGN